MTSASSSRIARRATAKAEAKAATWKEGDPIRRSSPSPRSPAAGSPSASGCTAPAWKRSIRAVTTPVSVVDVIALAVTAMIRKQPQAFIEEVSLVNDTLRNVQARIAGGESAEDAIAGADELLGGAIGDLEAADHEG
jgi:hypothetical protein